VLSLVIFIIIKRKAVEEKKQHAAVLRVGILAALTNMTGTDYKMMKIKESLDMFNGKGEKTQRTFRFLISSMISLAAMIILSNKVFTTYPNIIKALILSLFMTYIMTVFNHLRNIFVKFKIINRLKSQINYFRANFVEELRVTNKYTFEIT
jgi:hypothetical protein